jgi:hypothetical protein
MYIPIWILVIIVIGVFFYYFSKAKKRKNISKTRKDHNINSEKNTDWLDDENWKETMMQHLTKYPQRTGKENPTYTEMLTLDKDEFKAWLFAMAETSQYQKELLEQMINHEEKTGSFEKTKQKGNSDVENLTFDVFKRGRSKEVVGTLTRLSELVGESKSDTVSVVKQAIHAKAMSDYFGLGKK